MESNSRFRNIRPRSTIVPLVIIVVTLSVIASGIISGIKRSQYDSLKTESIISARNHSHSLSKIIEAQEIINNLLEEKLLVISRTITLYDGEVSNELLDKMARNFEVDKIYYYNSEGEILYSNDNEYIGWKSYKGHPVHEFMNSESESFVEEIRKDTSSEHYFKYAYFQLPREGFIQVGISADKIHDFLQGFHVEDVLETLKETTKAVEICLIDNNFKIISSTNIDIIGETIDDHKIKETILNNGDFSRVDDSGDENVYDIYVPVIFNNERIATLHFTKSLEAMNHFIKSINMVWIISLSVIFISMTYIIMYVYYKNKKLTYLAYYDSLTGLANKEYLIHYLEGEIGQNKDYKSAILIINCIDFKSINLISGYQYADRILKEMALKIKNNLDSKNRVFRFTADRFVIYVKDYRDRYELVGLVENVNRALKDISMIRNKYINIKIGIVEINNNYKDADQVLKDVSIALNHINDDKNYIFFNNEMEKIILRQNYIEKELIRALSEKNTESIYLEYQPQIDLKTNKIIGFEALARMKTEEFGFISPVEFISVAERKHLIIPLGEFILNKACSFMVKLNREGYKETKVAVNISGLQLLSANFNQSISKAIKKSGMKGSNLELEITESILVENFELINEKLQSLKEMGVTVALDDFGTGYSSFARLEELNIDYVKIDKSFIDRIVGKKHSQLIAKDIISMAHKIGLAVVAEGVELEVQKQYLIDYNCDYMQGYLFSRPLAEENVRKILKENT